MVHRRAGAPLPGSQAFLPELSSRSKSLHQSSKKCESPSHRDVLVIFSTSGIGLTIDPAGLRGVLNLVFAGVIGVSLATVFALLFLLLVYDAVCYFYSWIIGR